MEEVVEGKVGERQWNLLLLFDSVKEEMKSRRKRRKRKREREKRKGWIRKKRKSWFRKRVRGLLG